MNFEYKEYDAEDILEMAKQLVSSFNELRVSPSDALKVIELVIYAYEFKKIEMK